MTSFIFQSLYLHKLTNRTTICFRSRSDDCLYWQLLDAGKRPCPNWKPEWEQIENERSLEEDDKFKAPSKFAHNEISKTLREIRSLDTYYDIENEESTLLLHDN